MNRVEIEKLITERGLTITDVIDAVIDLNGIIGVGLVTLANQLSWYCQNHHSGYTPNREDEIDEDEQV